MQTVLVTGAGGYIGTTLVPMLLERGYAVRALDRYFFGCDLPRDEANLEIVREDCRRIGADHLDGVQHVLDLAAISNDPAGELFQLAPRHTTPVPPCGGMAPGNRRTSL